jgi:hypothetical protein
LRITLGPGPDTVINTVSHTTITAAHSAYLDSLRNQRGRDQDD